MSRPKQHADLFERIFNSVHSRIAYMDCDFNFIRVNKAYSEANGKPPEFFIGKNHFDLFPHAENEAIFRSVVKTGVPFHVFETSFSLPEENHKTSYWDWSLEPVRETNGKTIGVVLTLVDVTERRRVKDALRESEETKEEIIIERRLAVSDRTRLAAVIEQVDEGTLERQLRQAQKIEALGTLAGGIAHDLNNILMPIIMNAEMIEEDLDYESPLRHFASKVLTSAQRGRALVRRILNFSREKDEETLIFSANQAVNEAVDLVRPTLPSTIEIRQRTEAEIGRIKGDPSQLQEAIVNLCTNAAQAIGREPGVIEICLENVELRDDGVIDRLDIEPGQYIKLSVKDSGVGMDDSLQERIFEPFFTTKKAGEGTGMGLAMVHGVVRRHQGAIRVESKPGKGTTFDIYFPRMTEPGQETEAVQSIPRGRGEHVFLVDDEQDIVDAATNVLVRLGYEVTPETNADRAIKAFRANMDRIDLAILDFALPEMNGLELARQLLEICPDIPILVASGFSEAVDREQMAALGIHGLLNKPLTSLEVGQAIRRVLDK